MRWSWSLLLADAMWLCIIQRCCLMHGMGVHSNAVSPGSLCLVSFLVFCKVDVVAVSARLRLPRGPLWPQPQPQSLRSSLVGVGCSFVLPILIVFSPTVLVSQTQSHTSAADCDFCAKNRPLMHMTFACLTVAQDSPFLYMYSRRY